MQGRRDSSSTIWRTVVFAGAMLGVPACGGPSKPAQTTPQPQNNAPTTAPAPAPEPASAPTTADSKPTTAPASAPTPGGDPCSGVVVPPQTAQPNPDPLEETPPPPPRPRGGGKRPTGRGFVLA